MKIRALSLALGLAAIPLTASAQLNLNGTWQTDSGAVNGRGAGRIAMRASHRNNGVTLTYGSNSMVCSLEGLHCAGTWQGRTGSGWFDITFASDGASFSGTWGYGSDRGNVGTFTGRR